jgi:penicillin amidase
MKFAKVLLAAIVVLVLIAAGLFGYGFWLARKSLPQIEGSIQVRGLNAPVMVYRDANGVPHIFAQSLGDAAFTQGYVTAQDRLWQMDLFRRSALGELSEILGEVTLRIDERHCRMGFREAVASAVETLDAASAKIVERYAAGVNAFINSHQDNLPIEFRLLRYKPRPWTSADTLSISLMMSETLNHTWERDIFRGKLAEKFGPEILKDLYPTHTLYDLPLVGTDSPALNRPQRVLSSPSSEELMRSEKLMPAKVPGTPSRRSSLAATLLWAFASVKSQETLIGFLEGLDNAKSGIGVGSNNWVVDGAHSATGKPLLANDPHLEHSIPSIWYQTHLHSPEINVIGVTFPGAPGIVLGHNERIAWGATNLNPDVQDVFLEQFDSERGTHYFVNGHWVEAQVREETIQIKDRPAEILRVLVTRHGPIMRRKGSIGEALKWTALEVQGIGLPFLRVDAAANWTEFVDALREFYGPVQNFVYADIDGNIGFYNAGKIPIRRSGVGNVPVPGSTDNYEWVGYIPFEELPHLYNPPEGFIATANQRITGDTYPYLIGSDWEAPFRFARIRELLKSKPSFSRDDFLKMQSDVSSEANRILASFVVRASENFPSQNQMVKAALERLKSGDFIATPDNLETTIIEALRSQLEEALLKNVLGEQWKDYDSAMKPIFLENQLRERPPRWLPSGFKSYDELLIRSLEEVCHNQSATYNSPDVTTWKWGRHYPVLFTHPLGRIWPLGRLFNVGPFQQPGTKLTVKQTTSRLGPSMRMVVDFADIDHSYNNLTLGESGQPFSPYYDNQVTHWLEAKSYPMLFTDEAVKRSAVKVLTLRPY